MLRKITAIHEEANPAAVSIEVDIAEKFTLEDLKLGFNRRLNEKADPLKPDRIHDWTDDMWRFVRAWNDRVGWAGFNRIPQQLRWADDAAETNKLLAALSTGDPKVLTKLEQDEKALALLEGMGPEAAQRAINILQAGLKGASKKGAQKILGDTSVEEQTGEQERAAKGAGDKKSKRAAARLGKLASTRDRRGEGAMGGTLGDAAEDMSAEHTAGKDGGSTGHRGGTIHETMSDDADHDTDHDDDDDSGDDEPVRRKASKANKAKRQSGRSTGKPSKGRRR